MSDLFDKSFLAKLDIILTNIVSKQLTGKQKVYLRNYHKYSLEQKQEKAQLIREEINAKAQREAAKKYLRRKNTRRPRIPQHTLSI